MAQNIEHLRENGPSSSDELPGNITTKDKMKGVWVFKVAGNVSGKRPYYTFGPLRAVYYLRHEHDYENVVEKWLEANERFVSTAPPKTVRRKLKKVGPEFHDAIDSAIPIPR